MQLLPPQHSPPGCLTQMSAAQLLQSIHSLENCVGSAQVPPALAIIVPEDRRTFTRLREGISQHSPSVAQHLLSSVQYRGPLRSHPPRAPTHQRHLSPPAASWPTRDSARPPALRALPRAPSSLSCLFATTPHLLRWPQHARPHPADRCPTAAPPAARLRQASPAPC